MLRTLAVLIVGLAVAGPARAQQPCPPGVSIPLNLHVAAPICPGQPLDLLANACGPCVNLVGFVQIPGAPIRIFAVMSQANCMLTVCQHDSLRIPLGSFAAGHHQLVVEVSGVVVAPDSSQCTVMQTDSVHFDVPLSCPPMQPLPYTEVIRVGAPPACPTCPPPPICPGQPIPFFVAGHFLDNCADFRGLEILPPPPPTSTPPDPPMHNLIARITMGLNDCQEIPCVDNPHPWQASALLPPMPPGNYQMIVEVEMVSWCDSTHIITRVATFVPYTVAATCSIPPAPSCFLYGWQPNPADPNCETRVAPGTPGRVVLNLSGAALAGLQGRLVMTPPALAVRGLRLVGPGAIGMQLMWRQLPDGASFAAYREHGPVCAAIECPWGIEAIVAALPGVPVPSHSTLDATDLLATDDLGRLVPLCPTFAPIMPARICAGRTCDFNGDGQVDVRDLVLMVRCIRDSAACSDSVSGAFGCNGDGHLDLDDVLCCARVILYGRMPDSVATRPEPELRLTVGQPLTTATGVDVPVRVARAHLVGAARMAFSYPVDRFAGAQVELLGGDSRWVEISEAANGELVVGLIATAPDAEIFEDLDLVLRFGLAAGQQPSHDIRLVASEFAGRDGVPLAPGSPTTGVPAPKLGLELSAARPNPFGSETRFTLGLTQATDADLGIFDLTGRRIATLHQGRLEAGPHDFVWDGRTEGGGRVRDGVYFYRAEASGVSTTRKVVLLRSR